MNVSGQLKTKKKLEFDYTIFLCNIDKKLPACNLMFLSFALKSMFKKILYKAVVLQLGKVEFTVIPQLTVNHYKMTYSQLFGKSV